MMNCKDCQYMIYRMRGGGNKFLGKIRPARKIFFCEHPEQDYIEDFLIKHQTFHKETGEIGFADGKGNLKMRTSPKWCPLRKGGTK